MPGPPSGTAIRASGNPTRSGRPGTRLAICWGYWTNTLIHPGSCNSSSSHWASPFLAGSTNFLELKWRWRAGRMTSWPARLGYRRNATPTRSSRPVAARTHLDAPNRMEAQATLAWSTTRRLRRPPRPGPAGAYPVVGEHACAGCGQPLGGWGGYWRWIRGRGTHQLWIQRLRCSIASPPSRWRSIRIRNNSSPSSPVATVPSPTISSESCWSDSPNTFNSSYSVPQYSTA